jgi:hypothetical protein
MKRTRRPGSTVRMPSGFTGFRFPPEVILLAVGWYLRYGLSYLDPEELLAGRFPPTPPVCYRASWRLPGPDSHRQATTS